MFVLLAMGRCMLLLVSTQSYYSSVSWLAITVQVTGSERSMWVGADMEWYAPGGSVGCSGLGLSRVRLRLKQDFGLRLKQSHVAYQRRTTSRNSTRGLGWVAGRCWSMRVVMERGGWSGRAGFGVSRSWGEGLSRTMSRYSGVQASYRLEQEHHPEVVTDPGLAWEHASGHGWWSTKRDSGVLLKQKPG